MSNGWHVWWYQWCMYVKPESVDDACICLPGVCGWCQWCQPYVCGWCQWCICMSTLCLWMMHMNVHPVSVDNANDVYLGQACVCVVNDVYLRCPCLKSCICMSSLCLWMLPMMHMYVNHVSLDDANDVCLPVSVDDANYAYMYVYPVSVDDANDVYVCQACVWGWCLWCIFRSSMCLWMVRVCLPFIPGWCICVSGMCLDGANDIYVCQACVCGWCQ